MAKSALSRPIGLEFITRLAAEIATIDKIPLLDAIDLVSKVPTELNDAPYRGIIWDDVRQTMNASGKTLPREILPYMLGRYVGDEAQLLARYKKTLGVAENDARMRLPKKI